MMVLEKAKGRDRKNGDLARLRIDGLRRGGGLGPSRGRARTRTSDYVRWESSGGRGGEMPYFLVVEIGESAYEDLGWFVELVQLGSSGEKGGRKEGQLSYIKEAPAALN